MFRTPAPSSLEVKFEEVPHQGLDDFPCQPLDFVHFALEAFEHVPRIERVGRWRRVDLEEAFEFVM